MRNQWLAEMFMQRADKRRFGALLADLANLYTRGIDQYPADLTAAYSMLMNYLPAPTSSRAQTQATPPRADTEKDPGVTTGLTFAQASSAVAGSDGVTHSRITCFACDAKGHYASVCPTKAEKLGSQHLQAVVGSGPGTVVEDDAAGDDFGFYGLTFAHFTAPQKVQIPVTWLLLDSQSTESVFCNIFFLHNICRSPSKL
jgi:hypothetical protein